MRKGKKFSRELAERRRGETGALGEGAEAEQASAEGSSSSIAKRDAGASDLQERSHFVAEVGISKGPLWITFERIFAISSGCTRLLSISLRDMPLSQRSKIGE